MYRIAYVHPQELTALLTETSDVPWYRAFFEELRRLGYVEGQNLQVDRYSGEGRSDRYADLARKVVRTHPDVVLLSSSRMAQHFKAATTTIPIVGYIADPIGYRVCARTGLETPLGSPRHP
jgi:putative ABC transport system substrate-binding protein